MARLQLLILDLDGTVRECTVDGQPCPNRPGEQRLIPGAAEAITDAMGNGMKVVAATNQGGIGLGYMTLTDFDAIASELQGLLLDAGVPRELDMVYCCPHSPRSGCACRKPEPGMLQDAMRRFLVARNEAVFVGDRDSDREAAEAAGIHFVDAAAWRARARDHLPLRNPRTRRRRTRG